MISIGFKSTLPPMDPAISQAALRDARDAAGETVVTKLQDHWLDLNVKPNAKNWPKRGFWASVAQAVNTQPKIGSYQILMPLASFWRRYQGGNPIEPKKAKRLAIPAIAEAYAAGRPGAGRVPVELMTIVRKRGKVGGQAKSTKRRSKDEPGKAVKNAMPSMDIVVGLAEYTERPSKVKPGKTVKVPGRVWYWLVEQSNPAADPNAMPPLGILNTAATDTVSRYLAAVAAQFRKGAPA
jgi:hypothetical protein